MVKDVGAPTAVMLTMSGGQESDAVAKQQFCSGFTYENFEDVQCRDGDRIVGVQAAGGTTPQYPGTFVLAFDVLCGSVATG